jgi:hypothetical protein
MSEILIERSRRAEREYVKSLDPLKYLEKVMYESIDLDPVPDYLEEFDMNRRTTVWRFNYVSETFVIGSDKRMYYPYL